MNPGPPEAITCVDCLGTAHLITFAPEEGFGPGDVLAYRCADCLDRWDIVWEEADGESSE